MSQWDWTAEEFELLKSLFIDKDGFSAACPLAQPDNTAWHEYRADVWRAYAAYMHALSSVWAADDLLDQLGGFLIIPKNAPNMSEERLKLLICVYEKEATGIRLACIDWQQAMQR